MNCHPVFFPRPWLRVLAGLMLAAGLLAARPAHAQSRYSISTNGAELTDGRTGLIWQRCSAGQTWSGGTCSGNTASYTHEAALNYAQSQFGWRLPNIKELSTLVDRSQAGPSIDTAAFPGTPSSFYWSSSPDASDYNWAWVVHFSYGSVQVYGRGNTNHVRLVR